jgi:hypothetical protein
MRPRHAAAIECASAMTCDRSTPDAPVSGALLRTYPPTIPVFDGWASGRRRTKDAPGGHYAPRSTLTPLEGLRMHPSMATTLIEPSARSPASLRRLYGLFAVLGPLALGAPPASACDWWWACGDRPYASRQPPAGAYGYRHPAWANRRGRPAWAYGYSNPARAYGYAYAAWPSTSIPQSRWYLGTALQVPNANAVGLTAPISSSLGLAEGGLPARGPSLFGPNPPPDTTARAYYYGAPPYGYYYAPLSSYGAPPADTPSWWVEPRVRRR